MRLFALLFVFLQTRHLLYKNYFDMKKLLTVLCISTTLWSVNQATAQDNRASKRVSVTETLSKGTKVTIEYGQPSVKGRTIGVDLEPIDGQLWRTGANEATTLETDKPIFIMNRELPAGKYSLFTLFDDQLVTVIFNKAWNQWGTNQYDASQDVFRIRAKLKPEAPFAEQLQFNIQPEGGIVVSWGNKQFLIPLREQ
jgi:hypothetical protein